MVEVKDFKSIHKLIHWKCLSQEVCVSERRINEIFEYNNALNWIIQLNVLGKKRPRGFQMFILSSHGPRLQIYT